MKKNTSRYSAAAVFPLLLMALFILLLLFMLLFSAQIYRTCVRDESRTSGLYTAMDYICAKVHSHGAQGQVCSGQIEGLEALCLLDELEGESYTTYIYLDEGCLKEVFCSSSIEPSRTMGTSLTELTSFSADWSGSFLTVSMTDADGGRAEEILCPYTDIF